MKQECLLKSKTRWRLNQPLISPPRMAPLPGKPPRLRPPLRAVKRPKEPRPRMRPPTGVLFAVQHKAGVHRQQQNVACKFGRGQKRRELLDLNNEKAQQSRVVTPVFQRQTSHGQRSPHHSSSGSPSKATSGNPSQSSPDSNPPAHHRTNGSAQPRLDVASPQALLQALKGVMDEESHDVYRA